MPHSDSSEGSENIQSRIAAAKKELRPRIREAGPAANAQLGWRMAVEMVAGVGMGACVGYGLDSLFGISPIMLAVFTLLGFAAGVNLMLRTAREFQRQNADGKDLGE